MAHSKPTFSILLLAAFLLPTPALNSPSPSSMYVPPLPTPRQIPLYKNWSFSAFFHFGITTFLPSSQDNNCNFNNTSPLADISLFDPPTDTLIDTDNWLESAVAMGATQACFTVHHSGGFALWPSKYKNYTIANSPYGQRHPGVDMVAQFVASCRKFHVSPCFYIAPQVDCDLASGSPTNYIPAMMGMLTELLGGTYGVIDRLWLDTCWTPIDATTSSSGGSSLGTAPWRDLITHIHATSPTTATFPGVDGCEVNSDYGYGRPSFITANVLPPMALDAKLPDPALIPSIGEDCWTVFGGGGGLSSNVSQLYSGPPQPVFFKPGEDMETVQKNGNWFQHLGQAPVPWPIPIFAAQYTATVLRGQSYILNLPPNASGVIPKEYADTAVGLGEALAGVRGVAVASAPAVSSPTPCPTLITLPIPHGQCFNAIFLVEDLEVTGSVVVNYTLSTKVVGRVPELVQLPPVHFPGPAFGQWEGVGGGVIGSGVLDLLNTTLCDVQEVVVGLVGCLAGTASVSVEARMVNTSVFWP